MWVCATGAQHSKWLERRYLRTTCLRRGPKIIYSYYTRCALIRVRRPTAWTAWDGLAHPAEIEATCIWKVSLQIVVEISKSLCYECQVRSSFSYYLYPITFTYYTLKNSVLSLARHLYIIILLYNNIINARVMHF